MRRAVASIDRSAIAHNCSVLAAAAGEGTALCAVVKADGYGHGMATVADAAVAGGARWLAVAAAQEALELRRAGRGEPILVMGSVRLDEIDPLVAARCDLAVWSSESIERALSAAAQVGEVARLHVKFDSGMGRLGTRDTSAALELVAAAQSGGSAECIGLMTHFATADDDDDAFLLEQLQRFSEFVQAAKPLAPAAFAHAANSAATLRLPAARFGMVRCGIGIYGLDPFGKAPADHGLRPALEWTSWVGSVKSVEPGESVGYARGFMPELPTQVATVPVGYADGYLRVLGGNAEVLIAGRRFPVVGRVSMDNIAIDVGLDSGIETGAEVVLIGSRGQQQILAEELAAAAGTINYEIATSIGGRTERVELVK